MYLPCDIRRSFFVDASSADDFYFYASPRSLVSSIPAIRKSCLLHRRHRPYRRRDDRLTAEYCNGMKSFLSYAKTKRRKRRRMKVVSGNGIKLATQDSLRAFLRMLKRAYSIRSRDRAREVKETFASIYL